MDESDKKVEEWLSKQPTVWVEPPKNKPSRVDVAKPAKVK